jgi:hypothetical protein
MTYDKEKRKEFMQDLHNLLDTYKRFIDDPEYEDYQGDSYDFVLDDMQNIYAKWIYEKVKK